ncbi:MAG: hypothetical protein ACEQSA_03380 [Weeksellaceae bacterium]
MANTVLPPNFLGSDPLQRIVELLKFIVRDILKAYPVFVAIATFLLLLVLTILAIIFQDVSFAP